MPPDGTSLLDSGEDLGREFTLAQRLASEFLGSALLVIAAITPMILGVEVLKGSLALAVLMDSLAVAFVLFVLIEILGPISGCHINPAVTLAMMACREIKVEVGLLYIVVQFMGGLVGTLASHLMFFQYDFFRILTVSPVGRSGGPYWAEFLGTFTLVLVIFGCLNQKSDRTGQLISLLVGGFLLATSSTMFANPQVTLARVFTFAAAGIKPFDALIFIMVQILAALVAAWTSGFLFRPNAKKLKT